MILDLVGDIEIDAPNTRHKTNGLRFIQGDCIMPGRFGSDAWWIPLSDKVGVKIMHTRRYPKRLARTFRCVTYEDAVGCMEWARNNWEQCRLTLHCGQQYLPEVYGHLVVRHTGAYEYGMTKRRKRGHDENVFYPAWLMKVYAPLTGITGEELLEQSKAFSSIETHHMAKTLANLGGFGRNEHGNIIHCDIDGPCGEKCI